MIGKCNIVIMAAATLMAACQTSEDQWQRMTANAMTKHQAEIGKKAWFRPNQHTQLCRDTSLKDCTSEIRSGAATVKAVEPVGSTQTMGLVVYEVVLDKGASGFMSPNTFLFEMDSDAERKRAIGAKADCDRRGGIAVGMTADQVRESCWGKPQRVNSTLTGRINHEQWVYGQNYVYVTNGVVTSIQTSR